MPFHRVKWYELVQKYVQMERTCSCWTGETCNCGPSGYWTEVYIPHIFYTYFEFGEGSEGWQPTYSRGYPVPDKVPSAPLRSARRSCRETAGLAFGLAACYDDGWSGPATYSAGRFNRDPRWMAPMPRRANHQRDVEGSGL